MMWIWIGRIFVGVIGLLGSLMFIFLIRTVIVSIVRYFKKGTKMKIHWNKKEQQIMTKDGECLFDRNAYRQGWLDAKRIDDEAKVRLCRLEDRVFNQTGDISVKDQDQENQISKLQAQLQCSAKGHGKWVYKEKRLHNILWAGHLSGEIAGPAGYVFKCSACGLEITKTAKELTPAEKDGLKSLKLL